MSGPVLIFDSGVGGLSVVTSLRQRLPGAALVYACDNAMLPYGTKSDAWLIERIVAVCKAAVAASQASVLVVACNTASTLALDVLRSRLTVPVIGTVPAIKPAAHLSRSGHIALLATSATVNRPYTRDLIDTFAADCRVQRIAADSLVTQAEYYLAGQAVDMAVIAAGLAPLWRDERLDTVVLGCTHFPLLRDVLVSLAPWPVAWIDSGDAIARRTAQVVKSPSPGRGQGDAWVTADTEEVTAALSRHGFATPIRLLIPDGMSARLSPLYPQ